MRVNVSPTMMANLRFAYSPLLELTISYRVLRGNWQRAIYWRWLEEATAAIHDLDLPYMDALITGGASYGNINTIPKGYIPDFLTPTPLVPITDIEDEFDRLCQMDVDLVREGLQMAIEYFGPSEILCDFLAHPREGMTRLLHELREYWQRTLAHHWQRMMSVLENDMLHHSRVLTLHGMEALFPEIDSILEYQSGTVIFNHDRKYCEMAKKHGHVDREFQLNSNSLHLVPVIFGANAVYHQLHEPWQPMILYTARGAALWNYETPEPSEALEMTLGGGKARLILALESPLSSGEIARKLSLTAGAVSQQLTKLHQAGLVESHRSGKHVFYRLSERGRKLVDLFC
jgi:DNA-binding HxlR family transcriptional regulator